MGPPKHWDLQNLVYSRSKTVKVATDCGLFGRCSAPAISQRATRGQCVALYGKYCKEIQLVNPKGNQSWIFIGRTEADAKTPVVWHQMSRTNLLENTLRLGKIEGRRTGDDRGWDGWMASLTQWTWACVASGSWWWTGKPSVLQSMRLQSQTSLSHWSDWLPLSKESFSR